MAPRGALDRLSCRKITYDGEGVGGQSEDDGWQKKYFKGLDNLFIAAVDDSKIGNGLIWEAARNNQLFPHLYRNLKLTEIIWCKALKLRNGKHILPSQLT